MKIGRSLTELAQEITRQQAEKKDFVADPRRLQLQDDGETMTIADTGDFRLRNHALQQVSSHAGIPAVYVKKMQTEAPKLLASNVNHWLHERPSPRLVRTLGSDARAFLSDRYRRVDNEEVAEAVLPVLMEVGERTGGLEVVGSEVTESRLYIRALFPKIQAEVKSRQVGDIVQAGVMVTNSEVGLGAISVRAFCLRLVCTNGMVRPDDSKSWRHVGRRIDAEADADIYGMLTDESKQADDRALLLKLRDVVAATVDEARFQKWAAKMSDASEQQIEGDIPAAIEVLGKAVNLRTDEKSSILRHLVTGGDISRWGVANAVTRAATDVESFDRSVELEAIGGMVIDLPQSEWRTIANARPITAKAA